VQPRGVVGALWWWVAVVVAQGGGALGAALEADMRSAVRARRGEGKGLVRTLLERGDRSGGE